MYKDNTPNAQALGCTNAQVLECTDVPTRHPEHLTLNLEDVTEQSLLTPQLLKRYSTNVIAPSLLASNPEAYSELCESLSTCADNITLKKSGALYYHRRCKQRICSLCESIRVARERAKMSAIINELPALTDDGGDTIGITLTLNAGQRCGRLELGSTVKTLHKAWSRLVQRTRIKRHSIGYHRTTEVTVEYAEQGEPSFNPHIHATLLFTPTDYSATDALILVRSEVKHSWSKLIRSEARKLGLNPVISGKAQRIQPLDTQTLDDLEGWLHYSTKGVIEPIAQQFASAGREPTPEQIAETWSTLHTELPHQRLTSLGGLFRSALGDVKRERDLERAEARQRDEDYDNTLRRSAFASVPNITHKWSYSESRWIPIDEWTAQHGRQSGFIQRALLLDSTPREIINRFNTASDLVTRVAINCDERVRDVERAHWLATGKPLPLNVKLSLK